MTLVTVPCGLCGGKTYRPLYSGTIPASAPDPAAYFSSSRREAGHLPIVQCLRCGLVMSNPRDDDQTLDAVYQHLADPEYESENENRQRTARAYLALVAEYSPPPARLLDAGCATGIFVCLAHSQGWQATGIDPSAWSIARARERCPHIPWILGTLESADLPEAGFDIITLWDVLEHIPQPAVVLRRMHRWVRPGGWLVLNVPNVDSWIARRMGKHWVLLLREHLWFFSPPTITRLLDDTGFEAICIRPNRVTFSLANIAMRLAQYPPPIGRIGALFSHGDLLRRWYIRFSMGEMNVVARRT